MEKLAFTLPGGFNISAPIGIPTGGVSSAGAPILQNLISLMFLVAAVLAVIYLIWGGIRWITSKGDPKGIEAARMQIMYAVIGLSVVLLAFLIVNFIGNVLQIPALVQ